MKPGDKVFRVCDRITGDDEWVVEERAVKGVDSAGRITLARSFTGIAKVRFIGGALGLTFFRSREDAVRDFATRYRRWLEGAERQEAAARRAIAWAERAINPGGPS